MAYRIAVRLRPRDAKFGKASDSGAGRDAGLVLSASAFNRATGLAYGAPITTVGNASRGNSFAVSLTGAGTATTGVVQVDQVRAMDWRLRKAEKSGDAVPNSVMTEVLERFAPIFGLEVLEGE
ncbi:MAG: type II toxin-antitoxin system PemK/MazF family toxin [Devosia sp.]